MKNIFTKEISPIEIQHKIGFFLNQIEDALCLMDKEATIVYVNEHFCRIFQQPKEDFIGRIGYEVGDANFSKLMRSKFEARKKGQSEVYETLLRRENGSEIWIRINGKPVYDDAQKLVGILGQITDISGQKSAEEDLRRAKEELEFNVQKRTRELTITNYQLSTEIKERKQKEAALRDSEKRFKDIFNSSPDAIFVETIEGIVIDANQAACDLHGLLREELVGKSIFELNPTEAHERIQKRQSDLVEGVLRVFEDYITTKDGREFPVEVKSTPIKYNDQTALLLQVRDITERVNAQKLLHKINQELEEKVEERTEELNAQKNFLRSLIDLNPNYIVVKDREGRFLIVNQATAKMYGKTVDEMEGELMRELNLSNDETETLLWQDKMVLDTQKEMFFPETSLFNHSTNAQQWVQMYKKPILSLDGESINVLAISTDITELKSFQNLLETRAKELERSNEELERFAYVASHDLQGPLRTIASYLQLLEQRYKDRLDEDAKEFINFSVTGAKRMQQLIHDLLNYSRINTRKHPYKDVDLNDLLAVILKSLKASIDSKNAVVTFEKDMPKVYAEPYQMNQLFQNLIDNGMKFKESGIPEVRISHIEREEEWEFLVADNGIGISEEFKEKIFMIFQRLHTDKEYSGTGIGLAVCKKIVELHGGNIWFESELGKGTTFHFTISKSLQNEQVD